MPLRPDSISQWAAGLLAARNEQFTLIDVGVSGGFHCHWLAWESVLVAYGFDPVIAEIERLRANNQNSRWHYHDAWIICENYDELMRARPKAQRYDAMYHLTSGHRGRQLMAQGARRDQKKSTSRYTIDSFCHDRGVAVVDYIKTDTDGFDLYVLMGAQETLKQRGILGISVECLLHGEDHELSNNFANIDTLLRRAGFTLFDLNVWRYSRGALPAPFSYGLPAQTATGPVLWADAVYFKDPCIDDFLLTMPTAARDATAIKLMGLFGMFGLPDCTAQLLVMLRDRNILPAGIDAVSMLDHLVPENEFGISTYAEYVAKFDNDPRQFYPKTSLR